MYYICAYLYTLTHSLLHRPLHTLTHSPSTLYTLHNILCAQDLMRPRVAVGGLDQDDGFAYLTGEGEWGS